jgi:hypothetical protein
LDLNDEGSIIIKGGPIPEDKEVVCWNATRHGIRSPAPVVPGVEIKEQEINLVSLVDRFHDEDACRKYMEELR